VLRPTDGSCRFPQWRDARRVILETYDTPSLIVAYKMTLRLPLDDGAAQLSADAMIEEILCAEYGGDL
jgi:hypothetical protein